MLFRSKDIEEIKADYLKGLTFHYVSDVKEVIDLALLKEKVNNPKDFITEKQKSNPTV